MSLQHVLANAYMKSYAVTIGRDGHLRTDDENCDIVLPQISVGCVCPKKKLKTAVSDFQLHEAIEKDSDRIFFPSVARNICTVAMQNLTNRQDCYQKGLQPESTFSSFSNANRKKIYRSIKDIVYK